MTADELSQASLLVKYKDEIGRLKIALDLAFGPNVSAHPNAPEDRVVFPLGVASRNLCEEVIWFVHQGFGIAALRTARTLYECVVFSLYINKHPESWRAYLDTMYAQWAKILQNVPKAYQGLSKMHEDLVKKVPPYAVGKYISLEWNDDRNVFNMASDIGVSEEFHSLAFSYASAFVHPSALFLITNLSQSPSGNHLLVGVSPQIEQAKMALHIAHDMTLNAVRLRVKYSDSSALRESLELCEKDFINIWGFRPQLTATA